MPAANAELVRAGFQAFNAGDAGECLARIAPDLIINLAELPEPQQGRETWRQGFERRRPWRRWPLVDMLRAAIWFRRGGKPLDQAAESAAPSRSPDSVRIQTASFERGAREAPACPADEELPREDLNAMFRLDYLATRMRRNSENLLVLAGHEVTRRWSQPIPLVDMLRGASSEVHIPAPVGAVPV